MLPLMIDEFRKPWQDHFPRKFGINKNRPQALSEGSHLIRQSIMSVANVSN
jgi:hypothetical protein